MNYFIAIAILALQSVPAWAQSPVDEAERWGLIGTWAMTCDEAPSGKNPYYSYGRDGSNLVLRRNGGNWQDTNSVIAATITSDGGMEVTTDFAAFKQTMTMQIVKDGDHQFRTVSNRNQNNVYTMVDARFVHNGAAAPPLKRCSSKS